MIEAAILCENLSRRYGRVQALQPLDLSVPAGAVFGFLGRNGAGKTTTIRLLTGLANPSSGRAWVNGRKTTNGNSFAAAAFGYLPQEPAFYNWMKPGDFLDYVGRLFRLETAIRRQRVPELLELVGLKKAAKRRIGGFSGGMKQRLGLAQALIHRPPVLILDEPMAGMDPAGRRDVIELLDKIRGEVTVFLSSHILADVDRVCDTIGIIHEGKLLLVAGRDELLERYAANAIELEFARDNRDHLAGFARMINQQPWAAGTAVENNHLHITVTNPAAARKSLLPLIVKDGLLLNKYEWVRPSLEDVFLAISDSPEA